MRNVRRRFLPSDRVTLADQLRGGQTRGELTAAAVAPAPSKQLGGDTMAHRKHDKGRVCFQMLLIIHCSASIFRRKLAGMRGGDEIIGGCVERRRGGAGPSSIWRTCPLPSRLAVSPANPGPGRRVVDGLHISAVLAPARCTLTTV